MEKELFKENNERKITTSGDCPQLDFKFSSDMMKWNCFSKFIKESAETQPEHHFEYCEICKNEKIACVCINGG